MRCLSPEATVRSRPQYDALMEELYAVDCGQDLAPEPLVSPHYVP